MANTRVWKVLLAMREGFVNIDIERIFDRSFVYCILGNGSLCYILND